MEAKTQVHIAVSKIQKKLPKVTDRQKKWAYNNCFKYFAMISRNKVCCTECNHKFIDEKTVHSWNHGKGKDLNVKCPSCKNNLSIVANQPYTTTASLWTIWTTFKGYQVLRICYLKKYLTKSKKPHWYSSEELQYWIGKDGSISVFSKVYNSYMAEFQGSIELRPNGKEEEMNYDIDLIDSVIYPKVKILPEIYRNGFDGNFYGVSPHFVFAFLMNDVYGETLKKTGNIELFKFFAVNRRKMTPKVWTALKIAMRHNYHLNKNNLGDWLDYIKLLIYFKKDIHNPYYVCPKNLQEAHNLFVRRKMKIDEENRLKRVLINEKKEATKELTYEQRLGKYFDLVFKNNEGLVITPIKSIDQCFNESKYLKHCAFTNGYYKKKGSLLMSASFNDKVVETIEISLTKMELIQARGMQNQPSIYNEEIKKLIRKNLYRIERIKNPPKSKKKNEPKKKVA